MRHRIAPITLIALLTLFSFACDKPGATELQKETKASEEIKNASTEAQRQVQGAQVAAEKNVSAARADFETTRENYLHRRRLDLVDLDKKITDIEASAKTATGKAKADIRARLLAIDGQRDEFARHLQTMDATTAATWDGAAASLDQEWEALKKAVDDAL
jgi:hypothetical protein